MSRMLPGEWLTVVRGESHKPTRVVSGRTPSRIIMRPPGISSENAALSTRLSTCSLYPLYEYNSCQIEENIFVETEFCFKPSLAISARITLAFDKWAVSVLVFSSICEELSRPSISAAGNVWARRARNFPVPQPSSTIDPPSPGFAGTIQGIIARHFMSSVAFIPCSYISNARSLKYSRFAFCIPVVPQLVRFCVKSIDHFYKKVNVLKFCTSRYDSLHMNMLIRLFLRASDLIFPLQKVYAHCDVPCGLYSADAAKMAADTVAKMGEKILALPTEGSPAQMLAARNSFVRMVQTKEQHAELCKRELLILWTDFFKPEHVAAFPDLHETFWKAAKLCSKNKQSVDAQAAKDLQAAVAHIAERFAKAKAAAK